MSNAEPRPSVSQARFVTVKQIYHDYTGSGTSVTLAARPCDRAKDGEILRCPRAYTAIEDDFKARSNGEVDLKGIRETVEVFRLVNAKNGGAPK
ncbi:MAG: hypothetical protein ACR2PG_22305 [Hyphomicrobiaceae bacterium]